LTPAPAPLLEERGESHLNSIIPIISNIINENYVRY